jgi:hypothetical protein
MQYHHYMLAHDGRGPESSRKSRFNVDGHGKSQRDFSLLEDGTWWQHVGCGQAFWAWQWRP